MSGIVKLNIGGVKYETTVGTLTCRGDNFFTTLFSNNFPALRDEDGYYFIDRDGEYFKPLLSFLRTGTHSVCFFVFVSFLAHRLLNRLIDRLVFLLQKFC